MDEEQKTQRGLPLVGDDAPQTQPPGLAFDELKTVPPSGRAVVPRPSPSPARGMVPQSSPSSRGVAPPAPPSRSGVPAVSRPGAAPLVPSAARPISSPVLPAVSRPISSPGLPVATRPSGAPEPVAPPPVAAAPAFSDEDQRTRRALSKEDADETQTQRGLSTVGDDANSKTPAYGLRKLKPLRDKLDGKPPDNFGPIQVRKQRSTPVDDFDELKLDEGGVEAPPPDYASPENTQRVALSGETMRVTLERMARIADGAPEPEEISVVWGGRVALAPKSPAATPLPKGVRVVLAVLLFAALAFVGSRAAQLAASGETVPARAGG